jgi:hydrogenase maturation protease
MQKITIIGLGDVLRGDHGAACYVLESVATKTDSGSVQFAYMGNDPRFADELLYSADLAIVVGTMRLSGVPGGLHIWNGRVFKQHAAWMSEEDLSLRHLLIALARADLAGGFPEKLIFIWIEPQRTEGYTISKPVRSAIRFATRRIFHELHQFGLETGEEAYRFFKTTPAAVELEN